MEKTDYVSPQIETVEIEAEGVLCGSWDTTVGNGGNAFEEE